MSDPHPDLLAGVRVLDLSRVLAGPWATQLLADLGADVIKLERPGSGDDTRSWGPPWLGDAAGRPTDRSAYFLSTNRGKRSLALDLAAPAGARIARRLARRAHVVVENFRIGRLARFGLDYETVSRENPALVYCSISGFGRTGPAAARPGYDAMIQALGGLMSVTGEPDGAPQKVGVAVADLMCGMYATAGVLAAVMKARETGVGEHIDLALFDSQLAWLANQALNHLVSGEPPQRRGSAHPNIVPYQPFACADGYVMLAVGNDRQFARWCEVAGLPELATDPRFATNGDRVVHRDLLLPRIEAAFRARERAAWLEACEAAGIPCAPINDIGQAFAEPQAAARAMRFDFADEDGGRIPQVANPLRFANHPIAYRRAPPRLGEHTDEILAELGLGDGEIADLRAAGVL